MTKQTKTTIASSIFLAVVVLHIFGILSNDFLAFISKPFIITTLVISTGCLLLRFFPFGVMFYYYLKTSFLYSDWLLFC